MGNGSRLRRFAAAAAAGGGVALLLSLGAAGPVGALPSSAPDQGSYVTDGPVQAIAHAGGRTYIGGAFTKVGLRSGSGALLSTNGAPQWGAFPEVAGGDVNAVISDTAGGWYIGGDFTAVGGQPRIGLAHIEENGSLDPGFHPFVTNSAGAPAIVYALELSTAGPDARTPDARTLYVGGAFTRVGVDTPEAHGNVAALQASDGRPIPAFSPVTRCTAQQEPACDGTVRSLELAHVPVASGSDQPVLFVGGDFTRIGPSDALKAVRGLAAIWGVGATTPVNAPTDGAIVPGGNFGVWAPNLNEHGMDSRPLSSSAYALQAGLPMHVSAPFQPDRSVLAVYVGGWKVDDEGGDPAPLARAYQFALRKDNRELYSDPAPFTNWRAEPAGCTNCVVRAMWLDGSTLYFGGDFAQAGTPSVPAKHIAKIPYIDTPNDTNSTRDVIRWDAEMEGPVRSLTWVTSTPPRLLAAGDFTGGVLAIHPVSGALSPGWTPPAPDTSVHAVAADPSTTSVYAGGDFRSLGALERGGLAAFDSSGVLDPSWAPDIAAGPADTPRVHALAVSDTTVYAGGQFDAVADPGGAEGANLAALDAASGSLVGAFNAANPDFSERSDGEPNPGEPDVLSLALLGSRLYVGGVFDRVGGQARGNLAALDATTGAVVPGWDPALAGPNGTQAEARAILPACGAVYVGGWFDRVGRSPASQQRRNLAALDPATGAATSWRPDPNGSVLALARSGPTIYAGGVFTNIAGDLRQKVAGVDVSDGGLTRFNAQIDPRALGSSVRALAVSDSALYLGGIFPNVGDAPRSNLAAADPRTGEPRAWDPQADARVEALALGGDALYVGGSFEGMGTTAQRGFAPFGSGAGSPFTSPSCVSERESQISSGGSDPGGSAPDSSAPSTTTAVTATAPRPPRVSGLTVNPTLVRLGGAPLTVRFQLTRATRLRLRFERRVTRRCPARNARLARICARYVRFADVIVSGKPGANRLAFRRLRVGRRQLVPGSYRLSLTALPPTRGAPRRVAHFRVRAGSR